MQKMKKIGIYLCFTIVFAIGFHIIVSGLELTFETKEQSSSFEAPEPLQSLLSDALLHTFLPTLAYEEDSQILPEVLPSLLFEKYNLARYVEMEGDSFDAAFEMVRLEEALDEEHYGFSSQESGIWESEGDEGLANAETDLNKTVSETADSEVTDSETIDSNASVPAAAEMPVENQVSAASAAPILYSPEQLASYDFLVQNLYTVDKTTSIGSSQLNGTELMNRSLKVDKNVEGPLVLIYHTHSQEEFVDTVQGDPNTSIVGVGAHLRNILESQYGIKTVHVTTAFDIIDGKLNRSKAYSQAEKAISKILAENPTIQVVLDVHRDGVGSGTRLVTEVDGRKTAQIMFFNGLSYTNTNGDIAYLKNPNLTDNLAFSLQMKVKADSRYPGFARRIYLKGYRYNLHLAKRAMLVEVGAQTNTIEEAKNAMIPLAALLSEVLFEE